MNSRFARHGSRTAQLPVMAAYELTWAAPESQIPERVQLDPLQRKCA